MAIDQKRLDEASRYFALSGGQDAPTRSHIAAVGIVLLAILDELREQKPKKD